MMKSQPLVWWLGEGALAENAPQVYKIRGGNDLLPKALALRLAERIRWRGKAGTTGIVAKWFSMRTQEGLKVTYLQPFAVSST